MPSRKVSLASVLVLAIVGLLPIRSAYAVEGWTRLGDVVPRDLAVGRDGRLWVAEDRGYSVIDPSGALVARYVWPSDPITNPASGERTTQIAVGDGAAVLTLGVCCPVKSQPRISLALPDATTTRRLILNDAFDVGRVGEQPLSVAIDGQNRPWVLTTTGLWALVSGANTPLDPADDRWAQAVGTAYLDPFVRALTSDASGNVWLLAVIDPINIVATPYAVSGDRPEPNGLGRFLVNYNLQPRQVAFGPDGTPLFVAANEAVRRVGNGPIEVLATRDTFGADLVDAAYTGATLWIATADGLYRQGTDPIPPSSPQMWAGDQVVGSYYVPPAPGIILGDLGVIGRYSDPAGLWRRIDQPLVDGRVSRSFYWGPSAWQFRREEYRDAPFGTRRVIYYDKARMEVTNAAAPPVTNGLLVVEMVTGRMQLGDATFIDWNVPDDAVAGDPLTTGNPAPRYRDFQGVFSLTPGAYPARIGGEVDATIAEGGATGSNPALRRSDTRIAAYDAVTGHNIPRVFNDFMNRSGLIYTANGQRVERIADPLVAVGRPISEAYWTRARVAGVERDVLVQLFERRALTFTPANPAAYRVEMGNVGQHYYRWRYSQAPWEPR